MTAQEIFDLVQHENLVDRLSIENGEVLFTLDFSCGADEEPHDVSWDATCSLQDLLGALGLKAIWESDNDSIFGRIVELEGKEDG